LLRSGLKSLFRQQYFIHLDIVDIGGDRVHAVGWGRGQYTIPARSAKDTVQQINAFVAAYAGKNIFDIYTAPARDLFSQLRVSGRGIAMQAIGTAKGIAPAIFVRIQQQTVTKVLACTVIRF